jgi:hypothetical protein
MLRRLSFFGGTTVAVILLWSSSAFGLDCFLTNASPNSHNGNSAQWGATDLATILPVPIQDGGFGLACQAQVDAAIHQVQAADLPTVFFSRTTKTLPDAGGPGKGGIDHFDSTPIIGEIAQIAANVSATVPCPV